MLSEWRGKYLRARERLKCEEGYVAIRNKLTAWTEHVDAVSPINQPLRGSGGSHPGGKRCVQSWRERLPRRCRPSRCERRHPSAIYRPSREDCSEACATGRL